MDGSKAYRQLSTRQLPEGHSERIRQELITAGVNSYGLKKFAALYIYRIIHPYEHVVGAVYGRYGSGTHFAELNEGMIIATDRRIIFIDHKPGFTDLKEFTYDVVSGVERVNTFIFSSLTLFTRIGDITIHYANPLCVERFMEYVELRRLESESSVVLPRG